ncbi:hypothetical protein ACFFWD_32030 [Bradyrhizobium erythrophlei]|uniref:hypothetical protein n=1 Tax=Bradyrhizobium erythrophlei TaxID=1437360 RepID=UPI0035E7A05E
MAAPVIAVSPTTTPGAGGRDPFALPPFTDWERVMCEKCVELDGKIAHLKALSTNVTDELTLAGMALLTKHYEDQKRELHPEQK